MLPKERRYEMSNYQLYFIAATIWEVLDVDYILLDYITDIDLREH